MSTREDPEFNIVSQRFEYEDEEGQSWEQDPVTKQWHPIFTPEQIAAQQAAYSVPGVDETAPAVEPKKKKRRVEESFTGLAPTEEVDTPSTSTNGKKQKTQGAEEGERSGPRTGSVYIQNLPPLTTPDELNELFSKCGLILEDSLTSQPRIKIYTNPDGTQKGDAVVTYFREESVSLALQILDETEFRGAVIRVSKATFKSKPSKPSGPADSSRPEGTDTESGKGEKKKKGKSKIGKLRAKLADWEDESDHPILPHSSSNATGPNTSLSRTVILTGMFHPDDLVHDPTLLLDLKQDVLEECEGTSKSGVTSVHLFDLEEDGVMSVKFKTRKDAEACVTLMRGRWFGGRQVGACFSDGKRKFKRSGRKGGGEDDDDEQEEERLERFGKWLENEAE